MIKKFTCQLCGTNKTGLSYAVDNKIYCYTCYEKIISQKQVQEEKSKELYDLIKNIFKIDIIPQFTIDSITQEIKKGKTWNGIKETINYYYNIKCCEIKQNDLFYLTAIINRTYEETYQYLKKQKEVQKANESVDLTPIKRTVNVHKNSLTKKKKDFGYKIEDL